MCFGYHSNFLHAIIYELRIISHRKSDAMEGESGAAVHLEVSETVMPIAKSHKYALIYALQPSKSE